MASRNMHEATDNNFDDEVLKSNLPVMVYFRATWCGPCKAFSPTIEKIADDYEGKIKAVNVDIDDSPETARKYGVRSVPTVVVYKGGQKRGEYMGMTNRDNIIRLVDRWL